MWKKEKKMNCASSSKEVQPKKQALLYIDGSRYVSIAHEPIAQQPITALEKEIKKNSLRRIAVIGSVQVNHSW